MAGIGPPPKPASQRRRRNSVAGARTLIALPPREAPDLPIRSGEEQWHRMTVDWWNDIWASPMASEYDESDIHGLFLLAVLMDGFWTNPTKEIAAEIRLQRQCFGLTPIDRRRLQWEIARVDGTAKPTTPQATRTTQDPRLKAI